MAEHRPILLVVGQVVVMRNGGASGRYGLEDIEPGTRGVCYAVVALQLRSRIRPVEYSVIFEDGETLTFGGDDHHIDDVEEVLQITDAIDKSLGDYWTPDAEVLRWDWERGAFDKAFGMDIQDKPVPVSEVPKRHVTAA